MIVGNGMPHEYVAKSSTLLVLLLGAVGCSHAHPAADRAPKPEPVAAAPAQPAPAAAQPAAAPTQPVEIASESVYFDFDRSDLSAASTEPLSRFGGLLASNPDLHVRIEGNCDERGTEEYNMLLGQRRADFAKAYLLRMGAKQAQITTVSYGKDRPRAKGHDDSAWRQNRRDDLVPDRSTLPAKPVAVTP